MSFYLDAHVVATQMALQWYLVLQGPGARCYVLSGGLQRMGRNRGALLLWAHVEGQEFSHHIVASNSTTCALKCAVTFFWGAAAQERWFIGQPTRREGERCSRCAPSA